MMDIILDELQLAKQSLETGYISKKPTDTIKILIKYYYSIGMNKGQIRDEIELFMSKNYPDFNSAKWQDILDRLVKKYARDKYSLIRVERINITESELEYIKAMDNSKLEKLSFVLLVFCKIYNKINDKNNNWVNKESKELFKHAKITEKVENQQLTINKLVNMGAVGIANKVDSVNIQVKYVNNNSDTIIVLSDFRDFVLEYLRWKGENIKKCIICGRRIRLKTPNSNVKYCKECSYEVNKRKTLENYYKN
jgi:hypothetical protein